MTCYHDFFLKTSLASFIFCDYKNLPADREEMNAAMFDPRDGHVVELMHAAVELRVHAAYSAHVRRVLHI
jgi:hypothetical protein